MRYEAILGQLTFHFLLYREGRLHLAHCLETDTVAQGQNAREAEKNLRHALEIEIGAALDHGGPERLDELLHNEAPQEYWDMLASATIQKCTFMKIRRLGPERNRVLRFSVPSLHEPVPTV